MTDSFQGKRALLIGNGINQLDAEQSVSWGDLLEELRRDFHIEVDLNNAFKPFPLGFEEMLHRKRGSNEFESKLRILKRAIRRNIDEQLSGKPGFNDYHRRMMQAGYDDVLTTNYDYALQKSVLPEFLERKPKLARNKQESKFSLKRKYELKNPGVNVWHIHGELFDSRNLKDTERYYHEESIMIGYEHYASYLEKIQDNFKGNRGAHRPENQALTTRIKNGFSGLFWTDIFFTHHLDIVGQGLDYSENHLWWLLNQRANFIRSHNDTNDLHVNNHIRYFYPIIPDQNSAPETDLSEIIRKRNAIEKAKGIGEVLEAFEVETIGIRCESYEAFYERVLGR